MVSLVDMGSPENDHQADLAINECLNPESPNSFFLYAGAGSGKTYSLVRALEKFEELHGERFRRAGKKVGVITFTNAACDEIVERVKGDPLFHISTIHSFCWLQIKHFHDDIRRWLCAEIPIEIEELEQREAKGRVGTQASIARQRSIISNKERLEWLSKRREFTYNPNGDNFGKASLSHSDVLKICADFLRSKPSFQQLVVNRYPFLLIDESQDTNKRLIEALFFVEEQQKERFGLGLIGDMMQRIYGDGKHDLGVQLPPRWVRPVKEMNRRSLSRIVALANDIRSQNDEHRQKALEGKDGGHVRLFITSSNNPDKPGFEKYVREQMANVSGDDIWNDYEEVKHLVLEHMMAAVRMGFSEMYSALRAHNRFSTALNSGDLPAVNFFSESVLPLYEHEISGAAHAVMTHLRRSKSPLLYNANLKYLPENGNPLLFLKSAIKEVVDLIYNNPEASFYEVLQCVAKYNLFDVPQSLAPFSEQMKIDDEDLAPEEDEGEKVSSLDAIQNFLHTPFRQIVPYKKYVRSEGAFDTHQGVKGREFDRVLVVMDDEEAGGFLFSYEKLFEVKSPTKGDVEKQLKGEETGIDRTRRLFYVTCTRAEKSLALVAYSQQPTLLKEKVVSKGWFEDYEVVC
ncbi:MAG: ATP-dependent helicase [Gammaproteobacteria bacterium]|nr:ATP-dependent helicase [Gammaproteobacteria bacterium]